MSELLSGMLAAFQRAAQIEDVSMVSDDWCEKRSASTVVLLLSAVC